MTVDVHDVMVNDIMIVKPGESIPLDGIVIDGESSLDTKTLTGESLPLFVTKGDQALSGCINLNGLITVKVTKLARESTVSKILELVENASSKKAPTEKVITKFARVYTPIVTTAAILLAVIPPLFIAGALFEDWLYRALIFLVISCPCALVISIPLGFFGGIGAASKHGILVKGGHYLEALNHVEIAVFDKTGTLTKGVFHLTDMRAVKPLSNDSLLEKAAYIESFSTHPIATSIVSAYSKNIDQQRVSHLKEMAGLGISGTLDRDNILIGNAKLMRKEHITFKEINSVGSILYVAINQQYAGHLIIADDMHDDAIRAIQRLKTLGIKKTVMLSGDKKDIANHIGNMLSIDQINAELLPEDKLKHLEILLSETSKHGKVCYIGDGINDTPALALADIGIAMGGLGADAAIDIANIVIMTNEPSKVADGIKIAHKTKTIVWQNILFAFGVKLCFLTLGAFGIATMWEAVIADVGVALLAILNAMRILKYRIKHHKRSVS